MNTTPARSYTRTLTSATKLVAPLVAACLALAAGVPARGAEYSWDADGTGSISGGAGTWDTSAKLFYSLDDGAWVAWPIDGGIAEFAGTAGMVTIANGTVISVDQLKFGPTGYILTGGAVKFVGTDRSIKIGPGVITTFATNISSDNASASSSVLKLTGGGKFLYGVDDLFANDTVINLMGGTAMDLAGHSDTVGSFTLSNGTVSDSSSSGTLTAATYVLKNGLVSASIAGGDVLKDTAGIVTLSGNNAYTGSTAIDAGILVLSGTNGGTNNRNGDTIVRGGTLELSKTGTTHSANITVNSGATLSGAGRAYSTVTLNGGISPGSYLNNDVGRLTTNSQTWGSTGVYNLNINALPTVGQAGTGWDLIDLSGGTLAIEDNFTLRVIGLATSTGFDPSGSYSWLIATNSSSITVGTGIRIWLNDVLDTRFGLRAAEDGTRIGLYLDYTAVPEPKDYAMILGAITLGLVGYRRWRRTAQFA